MTQQTNKLVFETGATTHAVNDLILFTDNTKNLAEWRDKIYKSHISETSPKRKTKEYLASRFLNLFYGAKQAYFKEFPSHSNQHIKDIDISGMEEYKKLYAADFENWKQENGIK